jgi:hypothetical protein
MQPDNTDGHLLPFIFILLGVSSFIYGIILFAFVFNFYTPDFPFWLFNICELFIYP